MKKFLLIAFILIIPVILTQLISCSKTPTSPIVTVNNSPAAATPTGTQIFNTPTNTPTLLPGVFTYTPTNSPTVTPTFAQAAPPYLGVFGTADSPNGMYLANGSLYIAENSGLDPYIEIATAASAGNWDNAVSIGTNEIVVLSATGSATTLILKGPQGFAFTGNSYVVLDENIATGAATNYCGLAANFNAGPVTGNGYGVRPFNAPLGFVGDGNDNFYVADTGNSAVEEFNAYSGPGVAETLHQWTQFYNGITNRVMPFKKPNALALDATTGDIYIADSGYSPSAVAKLSAGGVSFISEISMIPGSIVKGMAAANGNLYVADYGNSQVEEFSPTGGILREWNDPESVHEFGSFQPSCIALDVTDNQIFVGDYTNQTISVFGPAAPF